MAEGHIHPFHSGTKFNPRRIARRSQFRNASGSPDIRPERVLSMMFLLFAHVMLRLISVFRTDREHSVASLPVLFLGRFPRLR
jgi:hypothetical protein